MLSEGRPGLDQVFWLHEGTLNRTVLSSLGDNVEILTQEAGLKNSPSRVPPYQ